MPNGTVKKYYKFEAKILLLKRVLYNNQYIGKKPLFID